MTVRSPPSSLAAAVALSAARRSRTPSSACAGALATPKLKATPGGRIDEAPVRGPAQALGHDEGAALVGLREQQRELLAADPRGQVDAPLPLERVLRDRLEGGVSRRVAVALVDRAEAVDVPDDHGDRPAGARGALELQLEQLLEGAPVQKAGQRVGAVRIGDPPAQVGDAPALKQRKARQHDSADGG